MGHQVETRHDKKNNPYRLAYPSVERIEASVELLKGTKSSITESQLILAKLIRSNETFRKDIQSATEFLQERKRSLDAIKAASFE